MTRASQAAEKRFQNALKGRSMARTAADMTITTQIKTALLGDQMVSARKPGLEMLYRAAPVRCEIGHSPRAFPGVESAIDGISGEIPNLAQEVMMALRPGIEVEMTRGQKEPIGQRTDAVLPARLRLEELETRAVPTPSIPIPPPGR